MPNWKKVLVSGSDAELNSLVVSNNITASSNIYIDGALYDNNETPGTADQVLFTTSTGIEWRDNIAQEAEDLVITGKNLSGGAIAKGTPLYFTGSGTSGNTVGIYPADAGNPNRMPAGGVAGEQIADDEEGNVYIYGFISGVDTSQFNAGDDVFVGVGGGYTNQKPTGSALIQKLGNVEKVDPTNGSGVIQGPSWYNDLPNWEEGKVKVGRDDGQPITSSVIHLDETNNRLGVNTNTPTEALTVAGNIIGSANLTIGTSHTNGGILATITGGVGNTTSAYCFVPTVGGGAGNTASHNGATVSGGYLNTASGFSSTVGGGKSNTASCYNSTVSGGRCNTASGYNSTVSGGQCNTASDTNSTIGGGLSNTASGDCSFVGGGQDNTASGRSSTVSGGYCNITNARFSTINGGHRNIIQSPTNECCSRGVTISGGVGHNSSGGTLNATTGDLTGTITCCNAGRFSTISGGLRNCATGTCSFVGGGSNNIATGSYSVVGGGQCNTASDYFYSDAFFSFFCCYSTVSGGCGNTSSGGYSTIGGGQSNTASGGISTISGGFNNCASAARATIGGGSNNIATGRNSVVGGGFANTACNFFSTISGGCCNTASGACSTIGGGCNNTASSNSSTVSGGDSNNACGICSTVGGGENSTASGDGSTVSGGVVNTSSGIYSTVSGGGFSTASGDYSTVGGGFLNTASGLYSGILGGTSNHTCGFANSFIVGSNLCATAACTTFMNNLNVKDNTELGSAVTNTHSFTGSVNIQGSGSVVFDIQGSEGQLFSITDNLSGSLFAVNDISGIPILEVFSDDTVKLGTFGSEGLIVTGSDASVTGDLDITGTLSKGAGSFKIPHPNPQKSDKTLWHSFVESPTAGDNIYRWQIEVKDKTHKIELPDYYKFLNENHQIWISPIKHFGQGWGEVNEDETFVEITTNQDGIYNVLLIGTRKDEVAKNAWKGTEREKTKKYIKRDHN